MDHTFQDVNDEKLEDWTEVKVGSSNPHLKAKF